MKPLVRFLCIVLLGGSFAGSARAQLVHLSFSNPLEGESGLIFRANSADIPWNHTGGFISRLDVYYDVGAAVDLGGGAFALSDPSRNLWRAQVHAYGLGTFEIIRPLETLLVSEGTLSFEHWLETGFEEFDFSVSFESASAASQLPLPPIEFGESSFFLQGGRSFFDVPDLSEGYGSGTFASASARIVQSVDFVPVPEPATYALGATALLAATVWWKRRRGLGAPTARAA